MQSDCTARVKNQPVRLTIVPQSLLFSLLFTSLFVAPFDGRGKAPGDIPKEWLYEWRADTQGISDGEVGFKNPSKTEGRSITRDGDVVKLSTTAESSLSLHVTHDAHPGLWPPPLPLVIEFKARALQVDPGSDAAGQLVFSIGNGRLVNFPITSPDWHVYRIFCDGETYAVYQGSSDNPEMEGDMQQIKRRPNGDDKAQNSICFGDESGRVGGVTEWEFVRWGTSAK